MKVGDIIRITQGPLVQDFGGILGTVKEVNRRGSVYPIKADFEGSMILLQTYEAEVVSVD